MKENHPTSLMWTPPRNHGLIGDLHPYISAGWYHTLHRWYPPVDQHCNIDMETQRFVVRFLNGRETIVFHIYVGGASHSVNGLHRNSIWDIPYYKWLISGLQTTHPQGKHVHVKTHENSWFPVKWSTFYTIYRRLLTMHIHQLAPAAAIRANGSDPGPDIPKSRRPISCFILWVLERFSTLGASDQ